jgi:hypothetical protein
MIHPIILVTVILWFLTGCGSQTIVKNCHNYDEENHYHICEKLGMWE